MIGPELTWANATCADGRRLVRWLESTVDDLGLLGSAERRALQRWRQGRQARVFTIDAVLTPLGLTLSQVPDGVWCPYDNGRRGCGARGRR